MRIAITVDPYIPVPPTHYGGIERVVDFLVRGLVERGHYVTLFGHSKSRVSAALVPYGAPPHFRWDCRVRELWQVGSRLWFMRNDIDIVHSFGRLAALLPILSTRTLPKVQSYQRDLVSSRGVRRACRIAGDSLQLTACSTHMYSRRNVAGNWKTVFNGVDLSKYHFSERVSPDAPLIFLGRLDPVKGVHHAISIARASNRRLVIAGNVVRSGPDVGYFDEKIAPAIDGRCVRYAGPVDDQQKDDLLGRAAALLMPIEWEEPFGIVMVEAMACGTPVIAFDRGSVPEIVQDGLNGFVCHDVTEAAKAVRQLATLDRACVRADAAKRFSASRIVEEYEHIYETMIERVRGTSTASLANMVNRERS